MSAKKDWTGQKFGRLTFTKAGDVQNGHVMWEAVCECGNTTTLIPNSAKRGEIRSCGCLQQDTYTMIGGSRKYDARISSAKARWRTSYPDCEFEIFLQMSQEDCHYCGRPPHNTWNYAQGSRSKRSSEYQKQNGNFISNGIDRIDSSKGHVAGNIIPCCGTCNWMKSNYSYDEFLEHIRRIFNHLEHLPPIA